jgi:hypothetical protein
MMRMAALGRFARGAAHARAGGVHSLPAAGHPAIAVETQGLREKLRRLPAPREADPAGQRQDRGESSRGMAANHDRFIVLHPRSRFDESAPAFVQAPSSEACIEDRQPEIARQNLRAQSLAAPRRANEEQPALNRKTSSRESLPRPKLAFNPIQLPRQLVG